MASYHRPITPFQKERLAKDGITELLVFDEVPELKCHARKDFLKTIPWPELSKTSILIGDEKIASLNWPYRIGDEVHLVDSGEPNFTVTEVSIFYGWRVTIWELEEAGIFRRDQRPAMHPDYYDTACLQCWFWKFRLLRSAPPTNEED